MKRSTKITLFCVLLAGAGWAFLGTRKEYYRDAKIESVEWVGEKLRIVFSAPPESMYWCPGADVKEEPDVIYFGFVRAGYKEQVKLAAPAEYSPLLRRHYVEIENTFQKPVFLLPEKTPVWTESMGTRTPR